MIKIKFLEERCKGCQLCISVCPKKLITLSIRLNKKGYYIPCVQEPEKCTGCAVCARMCPDIAIEIEKEN